MTETTGIFDIIKNKGAVAAVPPRSPEKLADAIIELVGNNKKRLLELKRNARNTALQYSWEHIAPRFIEFYQKFIK